MLIKKLKQLFDSPFFYYFTMSLAWFLAMAIFLALIAAAETSIGFSHIFFNGVIVFVGVVSLAYSIQYFDK